MGIVSSSDKDKKEIKVIEGNIDNEVKEVKYSTGDSQIFAYIKVTEIEQAFKGVEPDDAENEEEQGETEEPSPAFDSEYEGGGVIIHVKADEGVVPEGAELSVMRIEKKKITSGMSAEEKEEAEKVNAQYDMTREKLNEESEKKEQEMQGFLAYDISFMLDGKEIEPSGKVKVTMDFKEAVAPEGISENAEVAVNHLKENGNGGVKVENLTEASTTNITTAEEAAAVEKVELVANEFSIFTISWGINGFGIRLDVEHVDESGNKLIEGTGAEEEKLTINAPVEAKINLRNELASEWKVISANGTNYEPIKIMIGNPSDGFFCETDSVMRGSDDMMNFYSNNGVVLQFPFWELENHCLRIVYQPTEIELLGIDIDNNIISTGRLDVALSGSSLRQFEEAVEKNENDNADDDVVIQYVWYKSINGGDYRAVENQEYDNNMSSITGEYGSSLDVALDGGALGNGNQSVKYKVELCIGNKVIGSSEPESISYYAELQNGSFERPSVADEGGTLYKQYPQEDVEGWKTTAAGGEIEIARVKDGRIDSYYGDNYGEFRAADGIQFAELNAESTGSLYQDVLTVKGVQLNYSFSHRARPNQSPNEMYLVIVPTSVAMEGVPVEDNVAHTKEIDTQDEVNYLIAHRSNYPGVYVQNYTVDSSGWVEHSGIYTPQYNLNRFFFVSAEKNPTMGNFIDDVWFSQRLPEPKKDTFNFRIVKTVKGLKEIDEIKGSAEKIKALKEKIETLTFNISVETLVKRPLEGHIPEELKALDMEWTDNGNGSYTGVRNYYDIPIGEEVYTISVKEENADIDPYGLTTTVTRISSGKQETPVSGQSGEVVVKKDAQERLIFENVYGEKDNSTWEVVKRSLSDKTKVLEGAAFSLTDEKTRLIRVLTGETDANGMIQWKNDGKDADLSELDGRYILKETRAPEGYSCSEKEWILTFNQGKLDVDALKGQISGDKDIIALITEDDVHKISIYNARLYSLPSTGGKGIYLYMFSGILLMAGGLLMTYKNSVQYTRKN